MTTLLDPIPDARHGRIGSARMNKNQTNLKPQRAPRRQAIKPRREGEHAHPNKILASPHQRLKSVGHHGLAQFSLLAIERVAP